MKKFQWPVEELLDRVGVICQIGRSYPMDAFTVVMEARFCSFTLRFAAKYSVNDFLCDLTSLFDDPYTYNGNVRPRNSKLYFELVPCDFFNHQNRTSEYRELYSKLISIKRDMIISELV